VIFCPIFIVKFLILGLPFEFFPFHFYPIFISIFLSF
jgi:hypothetical protein